MSASTRKTKGPSHAAKTTPAAAKMNRAAAAKAAGALGEVNPADPGGYEPDLPAALQRVMQMLAIPGKSGEETAIAAFVKQELLAAGASPADIAHDKAHKQSPLGGAIGNLIFRLPGTVRAPRRLLMAHLDTVPICVGAKPKIDGDFIHSADPQTGLGADDRAGAASVLTAAVEILKRRLPHPPLTFFWPIQEEVGLFGSRHAELKMLGGPKLAFNWDGGTPEKLTVGATGAYRLEIVVHGIPSHAGVAPENGVSAIVLAALAIADLMRNGWHGLVLKGKQRGTTNVGVIQGGDATNVVTERLRIKAEARSHDPAFRDRLLAEITRAFERAAKELKNAAGKRGSVALESRLDYESFRLADDEPCVLAAEAALAGIGLTPQRGISNGGLDANWLSARGIPTVTMGCGQMNAHTNLERLQIPAFYSACRVALRLATATER